MFKSFWIILHIYLLPGTLFLPGGDFSVLSRLQQMYSHCKEEEDPDMEWADFFTDHLWNIDCAFDSHGSGDDQKPHHPDPLTFEGSFVYLPCPLPDLKTGTAVVPVKYICPVMLAPESEDMNCDERPPEYRRV